MSDLIRFFLYPVNNDYQILALTQQQAVDRWNNGIRFVDISQPTREAAEELRIDLLRRLQNPTP